MNEELKKSLIIGIVTTAVATIATYFIQKSMNKDKSIKQ